MKWIIRCISDNTYAVSRRFFVYSVEFARRFNSRKIAEAYMRSAGFDKKKYTAEELPTQEKK